MIDASLLSKFRSERIGDKAATGNENDSETAENLLDQLINKTVELAIKEGLIKVKNIIIQDSTHTNAMYQHISPREALIK